MIQYQWVGVTEPFAKSSIYFDSFKRGSLRLIFFYFKPFFVEEADVKNKDQNFMKSFILPKYLFIP